MHIEPCIHLNKEGFPKKVVHEGRTWHKVRDEEHRDALVSTNNFSFCDVFERVFGAVSWNLYYSKWEFKPTKKDLATIAELDEMLAHFLEIK